MAKDMMKMMIKIEDEAGWLSVIDSSEDRLVVIDIHQDWCGPTEAIHPTLIRVFAVCSVPIKSQQLGSVHDDLHFKNLNNK